MAGKVFLFGALYLFASPVLAEIDLFAAKNLPARKSQGQSLKNAEENHSLNIWKPGLQKPPAHYHYIHLVSE